MDLLGMEFETPFGRPLSVAVRDGSVVASGFVSLGQLRLPDGAGDYRPGVDDAVAAGVRDWLGGNPVALSLIPVTQPGSGFQREVWRQLRLVPGGSTVTYRQLAALSGRPRAARAVGAACAHNRVPPFVPCHRVVPTSGGVGRYGSGTDLKAALLRFEAV